MADWKEYVRERLRLPGVNPAREAEIVDDLAQQLDEAHREALRRGAGEAEARAAAERHVPNWDAFAAEIARNEMRNRPLAEQRAQIYLETMQQNQARSKKGWTFMFADLTSDFLYAFRQLRKNPGFTLVVVITLALGIGANSAIFSLIDGVLLRPLPVRSGGELIGVALSDSHSAYPHGFSYRDFLDYEKNREAVEGLLAYAPMQLSLTVDGQSEVAWAVATSGGYFNVLGVNAARGRVYSAEEGANQGAQPVIVLSDGYWKRRFGGDERVAGKTVNVNGHPFTVIGVAPPDFTGLETIYKPDFWLPVPHLNAIIPSRAKAAEDRSAHNLRTWALLKPGFSRTQAGASLNLTAQQLAKEYPATNQNVTVRTVPAWEARFEPGTGPVLGPAAVILISVVGVVLLIACANVANLLLSRATARHKEVAIRMAMGAGRGRLVRHFLIESLVLSLLGAAVATVLAYWAADAISRVRPLPGVPLGFDLRLDARVLALTTLVALAATVLFGLAPALRATRPDMLPALKGEAGALRTGGRPWSLRNLLVVAQVSLSIVLLVSAGLFLRSLQLGHNMDLGVRKDHALTAGVSAGLRGFDEERGKAFFRDALERVRNLPGVERAAWASPPPLDFNANAEEVIIEGREVAPEKEKVGILTSVVTPDYFEAFGTTLIEGRAFTEQDSAAAPRVAIINEHMAKTYWPGQSAIGKRIRLDSRDSAPVEIVGIARNGKYRVHFEPALPYLFLPREQNYRSYATLIVHSRSDMTALAAAVRREIAAIDPDMPLIAVRTIPEYLGGRFSLPNLFSSLLLVFGVVGLTLAAVGIYGVMAYSVSKRTREIGVRMALGAPPAKVLGLVLTQGMKLTLVGVGIGLLLALGAGQALSSILYGVSGSDPLTFTAIALLLALVALAACYIPARRAAKVDPLIALRYE